MRLTATLRRQENLFLCAFFFAAAVQTWLLAGYGIPYSRLVQWADSWVFAILLAYWVMRDAARRGVPKPFIFGLLLLWFWPVMAPWHVFKTRGWKGFATIGIFIGLYLLSVGVPYFVFGFQSWGRASRLP